MFEEKSGVVLVAVVVAGLVGVPGAGAEPVLLVKPSGDESIEVGVEGDRVERGWVLQDSYDAQNWRDLIELDGEPFGERFSEVPSEERYFRAVQKPIATEQEAITQARERWLAAGLTKYQLRYINNGGWVQTDDLILVEDGEVTETASMLPPEFPVFGWGEQTVEDLFDRLQRSIDGDAYRMFTRYHPTLGYPERAYVDEDERIADEEWGFLISGVPEDPEVARGANEKRWARHGSESYEFDLRYASGRIGWTGRLRVEGGEASVVEGEDAPLREHIIMTVDEIFAYIGAALSEGKVSSAAYDSELGYPLFFSRDWYLTETDGPGERFWITGFTAVGKK
ncbi:MAG: DUF6174 domain-containing protein [Verrucomicrobiales bacterium]|nr:DUF6174 domain-containing protein [Verrucomicrobiales bacterium]